MKLGGFGFSLSMAWAQIMPFVALPFFTHDSKGGITVFLIASLSLWMLLNVVFFLTIDLSYMNTFFGMKTAPQYTCELFATCQEDSGKFDAVFSNRLSYSKNVHEEVKQWVADNVDRWKVEGENWYHPEMMENNFLGGSSSSSRRVKPDETQK